MKDEREFRRRAAQRILLDAERYGAGLMDDAVEALEALVSGDAAFLQAFRDAGVKPGRIVYTRSRNTETLASIASLNAKLLATTKRSGSQYALNALVAIYAIAGEAKPFVRAKQELSIYEERDET